MCVYVSIPHPSHELDVDAPDFKYHVSFV